MATVEAIISPFNELAEFVLSRPTPQEIIAFKLSKSANLYLEDLLQRNQEGGLSREEKADLEQYLQQEIFVGLLKAKARLQVRKKA